VVAELLPRAADPETQLEEALEAAGDAPLLLVLDGVQDPHNLGACLRSADAAGVAAVPRSRDRAAGLTPWCARSPPARPKRCRSWPS